MTSYTRPTLHLALTVGLAAGTVPTALAEPGNLPRTPDAEKHQAAGSESQQRAQTSNPGAAVSGADAVDTAEPRRAPANVETQPEASAAAEAVLAQESGLPRLKQWGTPQVAPPPPVPTSSGPNLPDYVGKVGLGFHNADTPIGMRMWVTPQFGFDVGVGGSIDGLFNDQSPTWGVAAEGGILFSLVRLENMIVLIRGGLQVDFDDRGESDDILTFDLEGLIGIEYFLTALGLPNLSLSAGLSITAQIQWEEDTEQVSYDLSTGFRDFDLVETASLGFHWYF